MSLHIDNITDLMNNIKRILTKDGIFITESHYFLTLMKTLQYDTIYQKASKILYTDKS